MAEVYNVMLEDPYICHYSNLNSLSDGYPRFMRSLSEKIVKLLMEIVCDRGFCTPRVQIAKSYIKGAQPTSILLNN